MATIPSNFNRSQNSIQSSMLAGSLRVTLGTLARPSITRKPAPMAAVLCALAKEPEDARLTGGTRSLDRRLLALNLSGVVRKKKPSPSCTNPNFHFSAA